MDRDFISAHVAKRLSQRRAQPNLSLAQVAARCRVSLQQIYEIADNVLWLGTLWQLSKRLDTHVTYFFEGIHAA